MFDGEILESNSQDSTRRVQIVTPLKWAGGKRWLLPKLLEVFPAAFDWYVEPFAGGASAFFGLAPKKAVMADLNSDLITTFAAIRDEPDDVWRRLEQHARRHTNSYYYEIRACQPRCAAGIAARLLYLNRTCWNGLFRVNTRGEFNVPRGTKNTVLLPTDNPYMLSKALRNAELICSDFEMIVDCAGRGDLIYADPPYTVRHNLNGFLKLSGTGETVALL